MAASAPVSASMGGLARGSLRAKSARSLRASVPPWICKNLDKGQFQGAWGSMGSQEEASEAQQPEAFSSKKVLEHRGQDSGP